MDKLILFLCSLVFFSFGYRWYKKGSPYKRQGGDAYTRRARKRTIGLMALVTAGVLLVLGLVNTYYTAGPPPDEVAAGGANLPSMAQPIVTHSGNAFSPDLPAAKSTQYSLLADANGAVSSSVPVLPPPPSDAPVTPSLAPPPRSLMPDANSAKHLDTASDVSPTNRIATPVAFAATNAPAPSPSPLGPIKSSLSVVDTLDSAALQSQLDVFNAALKNQPSNPIPYVQRGNVYGRLKKFDLARQDYNKALGLRPNFIAAKFNLAELDFMEAKYDAARPVFLALQKDSSFEDLSIYSVFLCDLAGGHLDAAAREFDAINQTGDNASYYFANVAWSLVHRKEDDAKSWWNSANHIFPPDKLHLYQMPLSYLGYISTTPN